MSRPVPVSEFHLPIRVYYEDTDAGGIVYHSNYLRFAERARTEWLRYLDFDHRRMYHEMGYAWVVRACQVDFFSPARLDDLLCVGASVAVRKRASLVLDQPVSRDDTLLAMVQVKLAVVDRTGVPKAIPQF